MTLRLRQLPVAITTIARTFGARGAWLRAQHEMRRKAGRFRHRPRHVVSAIGRVAGRANAPVGHGDPSTPHPFAVSSERLRAATDVVYAVQRGDRVVGGEYEAYRWSWRSFPQDSAGWSVHPDTGYAFSADVPWWHVAHLDAAVGDIKALWEPARLAWVYDLVRAFLVTGEDRYAAAFHHRLRDWLAASRPFCGPHWSCGQETAIRAVALLYAEANLATAPASDARAMSQLADVLAASAERIADGIGYAVSQRNNHAISEAVGLIVLGVRFTGEHPDAGTWLARGTSWLERLIGEQFGEDGWYIQHSFTYLRVALDQCVIAQRALHTVHRSLSDRARRRIEAAVGLIVAVMDAKHGIVPNHGANDGAFVHPITLAEYRDFRPIVTAVCAIFEFTMPSDIAVDHEVLAWLGREVPPRAAPMADGVYTGTSGWAVARVGRTAVFLRAGAYQSRPGHIDPLQLDIRFDGREVVVDAGTFAYNGAPPWRNGLASATVHNGPVIDGQEPGIRGPRFLWYAWPESRIVDIAWQNGVATITAEVPGRLRRTVRVTGDGVVVEDTVLARDARIVHVRWLLHPDADPRAIEVDGEAHVQRADEHDVAGWFSPHYGERIASTYIDIDRDAAPGTTSVVTRICPAQHTASSVHDLH